MKKNRSKLKLFLLSVVFLAIPVVLFTENVPRIVDVIGLFVCGFASGSFFTKGISFSKK